jgi:hypothetical protein
LKPRFLLTLLLAALLMGLTGLYARPVTAQSAGLTMTATTAYDGYTKYGEWLPVWIDLKNIGADVRGDVRISIQSSQGTLVFAAPVELPAGSHKRFPVYVLPNNFSRELVIQLVNKGIALATAKATVRPQPNITYLIGILAPERGALALLNGINLPGANARPKVLVDLKLDELPGKSEGLKSFDLLILNDTDTSTLTPEQSAALAGWVQNGGHLVVGGGAGAQRTVSGLDPALLPVQIEGTTELDNAGVEPLATYAKTNPILLAGPFASARATASAGSTLAGKIDQPLVQEMAYGSGTVDWMALDLATVPFDGWPGTEPFWETLIGPGGAYPENMPFDTSIRQWRANSLFYALSNIPSLDLPSIRGLSILLIIYILIVGPLNYLVLRRLKRMQLAWLTIPAITAVFTGAAFGIGYTMRGTDLVLNKISLIDARQDGDAAITSYMGLFSPRQQSYKVIVNGEGLISPMAGYDSGGWGGTVPTTGGEMVFTQGQPSSVQGLTVNQWAMQSFMSEGTWKNFGTFTGELHLENEALVGTIRNDTSYPITDVVLAIQSRFQRLGDLAPGEEKPVNLGLSSLQSDRFGAPLSYRLFQQEFPNSQMPRSVEQKSNIFSSVFENGPMWKELSSSKFPSGSASPYNGILVFGWMSEAPPEVLVEGSRLSQQATAIVYTQMDYTVPDSAFLSIPPGMIPGGISKVPQNGGSCGMIGTTSVNMGRGEAELEYQIPENMLGRTVEKLKLNMTSDNAAMWGSPSIALYHWAEDSWMTIQEPVQGVNVINEAAPYVSETGVVRIRVTSENDNYRCIYLDLGLEMGKATGGG